MDLVKELEPVFNVLIQKGLQFMGIVIVIAILAVIIVKITRPKKRPRK